MSQVGVTPEADVFPWEIIAVFTFQVQLRCFAIEQLHMNFCTAAHEEANPIITWPLHSAGTRKNANLLLRKGG